MRGSHRPTTLVSCTARVALPWTLPSQTWGASLGSTLPLLAQEVLELVHQLLRVEVVITAWVQRLVPCRVIGLLQLPYITNGVSLL